MRFHGRRSRWRLARTSLCRSTLSLVISLLEFHGWLATMGGDWLMGAGGDHVDWSEYMKSITLCDKASYGTGRERGEDFLGTSM